MRKARGMKQSDLAEKLGVDQSTVSDIERGARFVADLLMKMSDVLGASPSLIMRGHDQTAWPFKRVDFQQFMSLEDDDRLFLEGKFAGELERLSPTLTDADRDAFNRSHVRMTKKPAKKRAA